MSDSVKKYNPKIRFYRPNKNNDGFASQWELSESTRKKFEPLVFFLSISKQTGVDENGNASFNWDGAIKVKLDLIDLGELIAVLSGRKSKLGMKGNLYHQSPDGGSKIIELSEKDDGNGYFISVSGQSKEKQSMGKYYHVLSQGDASILLEFLKLSVQRIFEA